MPRVRKRSPQAAGRSGLCGYGFGQRRAIGSDTRLRSRCLWVQIPNLMNCPTPPLSLPAALDLILHTLEPQAETEKVGLPLANGRILADGIEASRDVPPFASSAMDGYALRHADVLDEIPLRVVATVYAGAPWPHTLAPGQCVRLFTGAPVPAGADTVVMQEQVNREGDAIRIKGTIKPGDHIRPRGDEARQGDRLLPPGQQLTPENIGLIASLGQAHVKVKTLPRIALFTTGDELCPLDQEPACGQIYDSNRYLLKALLNEQGLEARDHGIIPDDPDTLRQTLLRASTEAAVILTTGGASVGEADQVVNTVRELGEVFFWQVAIKPGKPFLFGRVGSSYLFGLPGNPVAVSITFRQLVLPGLMRLMGRTPPLPFRCQAKTLTPLKKQPGRLEFKRAHLQVNEQGEPVVRAMDKQGSHQLSGFSEANALILLAPDCTAVAAGEFVTVELLP